MVPVDELLVEVGEKLPCRTFQAQQLACFLNSDTPALPAVVVHGTTATGKSSLVKIVLDRLNVLHAVVPSRECITGRHLLERTLTLCVDAVRNKTSEITDLHTYNKCESLNALAVHLQRLLEGGEKFVLAFDDIDRQRDAPPTLLPALARLNESIPNLTILFIVKAPKQGFLHRAGVPYIHFPAYTREEILSITARTPLPIKQSVEEIDSTEKEDEKLNRENEIWLWERFITAVYDSQGKAVASDIISFKELASKLWRPFVASINDGTYGPRDFSKLMVAKRSLFQSEDMLVPKLVQDTSDSTPAVKPTASVFPYNELPYYAKHLLVAAYLASYNPPRTDSTLFTHTGEKKRKKKGGAPGGSRAAKNRKTPRRLLTPSAFPIERLLAIFHALLTQDVKTSLDVYTEIATLTELRLLVRSGVGGDPLDGASAKWRVNVGWESVQGMGRSVGIEVADYLFE